jgi:hypothetical protein
MKTKVANSQPALRSHRRAKSTASHRPRRVKLAQSRLRIEHRTYLVIPKVRKTLFGFRPFVQNARLSIPWKRRRQPSHGITRPRPNPPRSKRIGSFNLGQTVLQPHGIQLIDGKHPHATLRASRMTNQPLAAAPGSIG